MSAPFIALTIAGADSGGGAGIQADLKTFEAHGVFGTCVITALTAQNTSRVAGVMPVPVAFVTDQLQAVRSDMPVKAAKTGMLWSAEIIVAVSEAIRMQPLALVVDPVMVATSGDALSQRDIASAYHQYLLPLATLVTPNLMEAAALTGAPVTTVGEMEAAARKIQSQHPKLSVLVKAGHLQAGTEMNDLLLLPGGEIHWLNGPRIDTRDTHGTGCTLSAALTANLAMGFSVKEAADRAKRYLTRALQLAWTGIGSGRGSLRHSLETVAFP